MPQNISKSHFSDMHACFHKASQSWRSGRLAQQVMLRSTEDSKDHEDVGARTRAGSRDSVRPGGSLLNDALAKRKGCQRELSSTPGSHHVLYVAAGETSLYSDEGSSAQTAFLSAPGVVRDTLPAPADTHGAHWEPQ